MSKDRINATLKRRTDEWVAAGRWTYVNGNPFSAVAGDVLVDIRVRGDDAAQERVLAKNVNWSTVAYYRVSELGPPSTMPLPFYEVKTPSGSMYRVLAGVPIAWTGGACPVYEDVIVEVKFADSECANGGPIAAGKLRWEWKGNGGDIIEFKIAADQGVVVAGHRKAIKPGCAGCETAICDECGPSRLNGITIRDTNTIVNAFAQGGAADQMVAAAHSVGEAIDKHVKAAQEVRKNQLWKNKAVRQNIVRIVSVEPHRVLVERADGQRYFVARDKLHVHWSLHGVDVNSPEYMAAQRRLTQLLTEEHDDAVRDSTKVNIMGDLLVESRPAAVKTLMSLGYRYEGGEMWVPPIGKALPFSALDLLDAAAGHMRDRAATYDKPEGERSMGKTVQAFNAITGRNMEAATKIQSMLVALKAVFETRGDDPVSVEMIDGLLVYAKDIKPVLRESEGWLLMAVLKMVRSETRETHHEDSVTDLIAYCALFGEARLGTK